MDTLEILLEATLAASVAIVLVMALRWPLRRAFGARVAYGAWGLVPASIVAVLLPAAQHAPGAGLLPALPRTLPAIVAPAAPGAFDPGVLVAACWLAGAVACLAWLWKRQLEFHRALGRLAVRSDGVSESEREVDGLPATIGLWSPRVVVPPSFESRYDPTQRELMLAHERAHAQRGDVQANGIAALLRCVFWFNPLLHLAALRFHQDQELACDATVLALHPGTRRAYGEALLQAQLVVRATQLGCHFGFGHPLRERIAMLGKQPPSKLRRHAGGALVAVLALGSGFAAWATQPTQVASMPKADLTGVAGMTIKPPAYPAYALEHNLSGGVVVVVDVAADGSVTNAAIERSEPKGIFDESVLAAVRKWQFTPSMKDGKPVAGRVRVPIEFRPENHVQ